MAKKVEIHPASIKYLKKGHPWITKDTYSAKFPLQENFIWAKLTNTHRVMLLNDPNHPQIKARLWSVIHQNDSFNHAIFKENLIERLEQSFSLREELSKERDNMYLVFGEADHLPGIHIIKLKDRALIQLYSTFWNSYEQEILEFTKKFFKKDKIWIQKRNKTQKLEFKCLSKGVKEDSFVIEEFGVKYNLTLNEYYDVGIYTDMSAIRKKLESNFEGKRVLNLYAYTGAYSLFALKKGATQVTSVDLSKKYIEWLERNIETNDMDATLHRSMTCSVESALKTLIKEEVKFDIIICDPPSSSTDGKKRTKAIDAYKNLIPLMEKVLDKKGEIVSFLNTHSITRKKFENKMRDYTNNLPLSVSGSLKLNADCPSLKGFIEGDYLKGIRLYKK